MLVARKLVMVWLAFRELHFVGTWKEELTEVEPKTYDRGIGALNCDGRRRIVCGCSKVGVVLIVVLMIVKVVVLVVVVVLFDGG